MPGGKVTIKHEVPDLESYLARKRYPLDKWLLANNIVSEEAFKRLISSDKWVISLELHRLVSELLKPVFVPATAIVEVVEVPVEPEKEIVPATEPKQEVIEQQIFAIEEQVVLDAEQPSQPIDEVSVVSSHSFKERKKSR